MIDGIQIKVCGLTSAEDAAFAGSLGADYLGFIFHPQSPRYLTIEAFRAMEPRIPRGRRVAVTVEPEAGVLSLMRDAGFERFQVHFRHDTPLGKVAVWSEEVGAENLWLAPKLPPDIDIPDEWLPLAGTFLIDTFDKALFGGTGRTGDWPRFRRLQADRPAKTWILSGGLAPANVAEALAGSRARFVDVASGVESAPGVKDHAKLRAFFAAAGKPVPA